MFDLIIRNGRIVDGTGAPAFDGDVAIEDGGIAENGSVSRDAQDQIDAEGRLVTPGFVDPHGHYDGQVTDAPSSTSRPPMPKSPRWQGSGRLLRGKCWPEIQPANAPPGPAFADAI